MRGLRIVHFNGTMKPGHDGVTRVLYHMFEDLRVRDVEALGVSPIVPPASDQAIPMVKVPSVVFPLYDEYRIAVPGYRSFESSLDGFRPHLLHIHSPCSLGYAAVNYARKKGLPVVATYHTHFTSYARYYNIRPLEGIGWSYLRGLYGRCERVFVPSAPILEELQRHRITRLELLPHGVDAEGFHPRYRSAAWRQSLGAEGKDILLFAGRLVWEKDLRTLAGTAEILREQWPNAVVVIAGDGPVRAELEGMMPEARFLGQLSKQELATAYASSDLFVFPSTTETFGNVVVEAMASGLPPVCVTEGGAGAAITDGINGLLARPRDPRDLAARILWALSGPGRRDDLSRQARMYAEAQTWKRVLDRLYISYGEIVTAYVQRRLARRRKQAA